MIYYGRIVVLTNNKKGTKLKPSGETMIMDGHALQHKQGSYKIYNSRTKKVIITII